MKTLGVLRTIGGSSYSPDTGTASVNEYGDAVNRWAKIPRRVLRNDGFHDLVLMSGYRYRVRQDPVGWLFYREDDRNPHRYLWQVTFDGGRAPADALDLAHRSMVLTPGHEYVIEEDETGAWRVLATADVTV